MMITGMFKRYSKIVRRFFWYGSAGLLGLILTGCASVSSTSMYYFPSTTTVYPPKPKDAPIPILGKSPDRPYKSIGNLTFSTSRGWPFLRDSILYNARANGADAAILRNTNSQQKTRLVTVPPRFNYIPVPGPVYRNKKGEVYYGTTYIPDFQPGYVFPSTWTITSIDAEMIVFKK